MNTSERVTAADVLASLPKGTKRAAENSDSEEDEEWDANSMLGSSTEDEDEAPEKLAKKKDTAEAPAALSVPSPVATSSQGPPRSPKKSRTAVSFDASDLSVVSGPGKQQISLRVSGAVIMSGSKTAVRAHLVELSSCDNWAEFKKRFLGKISEGAKLLENARPALARSKTADAPKLKTLGQQKLEASPAKRAKQKPAAPIATKAMPPDYEKQVGEWTHDQMVAFVQSQAESGASAKRFEEMRSVLAENDIDPDDLKSEAGKEEREMLSELVALRAKVAGGVGYGGVSDYEEMARACTEIVQLQKNLEASEIPAAQLCDLEKAGKINLSELIECLTARTDGDERRLLAIKKMCERLISALEKVL